jgi:hypothetical protein
MERPQGNLLEGLSERKEWTIEETGAGSKSAFWAFLRTEKNRFLGLVTYGVKARSVDGGATLTAGTTQTARRRGLRIHD